MKSPSCCHSDHTVLYVQTALPQLQQPEAVLSLEKCSLRKRKTAPKTAPHPAATAIRILAESSRYRKDIQRLLTARRGTGTTILYAVFADLERRHTDDVAAATGNLLL